MIRAVRTLIIGGTGRKSGKTSLAVSLISRHRARVVTAVKITPHRHPETSGLVITTGNEHFTVYEERNASGMKDTSLMLRSGAERVFLVTAGDGFIEEAFRAVRKLIPPDSPVIYESPSLRNNVVPDLFVMMRYENDNIAGGKQNGRLLPFSDVVMTFREIEEGKAEIIDLDDDNNWYLKR